MSPLSNDIEKTEQQPKRRSYTAVWLICGFAAALALALLLSVALVGQLENVFPRIQVQEIKLGGKTQAEAAEALRDAGWDGPDHTVLTVSLPAGEEIGISAGTAGWIAAADDVAQAAWNYGRTPDHPFSNFLAFLAVVTTGLDLSDNYAKAPDADAIRQAVDAAVEKVNAAVGETVIDNTPESQAVCLYKGGELLVLDADTVYDSVMEALGSFQHTLNLEPELTSDAQIRQVDMDALAAELCKEPQNAYYDAATQTLMPGQPGMSFDAAEAKRLWNEAKPGELVRIPAVITQPELLNVDESMLYANLLSSKTTYLSGSSAARIGNITLAASRIDGTVLLPGQTFSYNDALGQRTIAAGFQAAGAYANGQVVQEVGGGICQVSSTLYYCAMVANLQIDARTNHYFNVGYIEPGMDATVSWGGPEFKFTNNRTFPIVIRAHVAGGGVTVEIWGTDVDGTSVRMTYYQNGMSVTTYRGVYDRDGNQISNNQEAYSLYHVHE